MHNKNNIPQVATTAPDVWIKNVIFKFRNSLITVTIQSLRLNPQGQENIEGKEFEWVTFRAQLSRPENEAYARLCERKGESCCEDWRTGVDDVDQCFSTQTTPLPIYFPQHT